MQRLLSHGALGTANNSGQTPLHFASQEGRLDVVNLLLSGPSGQAMVTRGWGALSWQWEAPEALVTQATCPAARSLALTAAVPSAAACR